MAFILAENSSSRPGQILLNNCQVRLGDRRAQDSQELSRAPQDH
jgi:hypothetical protein